MASTQTTRSPRPTEAPRCCAGKNKYHPRRFAAKKADIESARMGERLHAYLCPSCGFFHIGHRR